MTMIGFHRLRQPERDIRAMAEAQARAFVATECGDAIGIVIADEIRFLKATTECRSPDGHIFVASCTSIACVHNCGRIVWL